MSAVSNIEHDPIAIIGIGCRFPGGAKSPRHLWELLTQGRCAIVEVPKERWDHRRYYDPDPDKPGKTYVRAGGFLQEAIDTFDAAFFSISPREAATLDPQQRLLAEVAWESLEDAGLPADKLAGSPTGVYVGGFMLDSMLTHMGPMNRELIGPHTAVGSTMTVLSNRLSYMFDFQGPSISLDTACSSSMVAVHLACQDLRNGTTSLALAGGVNVMFRPEIFVAMSKGKFLSADGYSKSFDTRADGYGRGEGAGIVVLKRLSDAVRDQDRVYAVIRGTGVNQDGHSESMTAPSSRAQEALIRRVCASAALDPTEIHAFEAHGTGTAVGDPAELGGLGAVSKREDGQGPWVGSLKANIGHLEAAAGVAGLIKASLCLQHRQLPPQANLRNLNPAIPFDTLGIRIPRALETLAPRQDEPLRMGVNSFGYGGTNAHCVIEQAPSAESQARADGPPAPLLLPLSARSPEALRALAQSYAEMLAAPASASLSDICFSAATRRAHHEHRLALLATEDVADLTARLTSFASGNPAELGASGRTLQAADARPVFVFTGMGPQWWAMGRELYAQDALFRATLDRCDALFQRLAGWSLLEQMLADEKSSNMARTDIAQPANTFLQIGLLEMWRRAGITPAAVIGHSAGEVASAYAAGRFTLEQAILVIYERSRIQAKAAGQGKMAAVGLSEEGARAAIRGREDLVSIAAINGPNAVTLSGDAKAIEEIAAELEARGVFQRILKVEVPYHSPAMEGLKPELRRCLAALKPSAGHLPTYSTVTGGRIEGIAYDAEYWCDNIREPTLFAKAAGQMLKDGYRLFIELGPHPVLLASIKECCAEARVEGRVLTSLRRQEPEHKTFIKAVAELYVAGIPIDWSGLYPQGSRYTPLPTYPWQRERHWHESEEALTDRRGSTEHSLLGPRVSAPLPTWERGLNARFLPCLQDHRVRGSLVVPGATYVELALAVRRAMGLSEPHALEEVRFENALVVTGHDEPVVRTTYDEAAQTVTIYSRPRDNRTAWTRHATARIRRSVHTQPEMQARVSELGIHAEAPLDTEALYRMLATRGLEYGPSLRGIRTLRRNEKELLAEIVLPEAEVARITADSQLLLDPVWLDPCLQAMVSWLPEDDTRLYLPMGCRSIQLSTPPEPHAPLWCHARIRARTAHTLECDITLLDGEGRVSARLTGVECAALADREESVPRPAFYDWTYTHAFEATAEELPAKSQGTWLVFADQGGIGAELTRELQRTGIQDLVLVTRGETFVRESNHRFQIRFGNAEDVHSLVEAVGRVRIQHVAYLAGLDARPGAESNDVQALLDVVLALAPGDGASLRIVTRDAQRAAPGDALGALSATPLIGFARVVPAEFPHLRTRSIDLPKSAAASQPELIERLARELLADTQEEEVALRDTRRFVRRLSAKPLPEWEAQTKGTPALAGVEQVFEIALDGAERRPRRATRKQPERGEVEIKVTHVTLTRAAAVQGRRASDTHWPLEVGGVVVAVGEATPGFTSGQVVQALVAQEAPVVGTHVVLRLDRDFISAGTSQGRLLPFLGAEYALHVHGHIQPSERLLVIGDAGGVGTAVVELGRAAGARTAIILDGDTRQAPEGVRVFDRRSPSLPEDILAWTNGAGVDLLVNASCDAEPTITSVLGSFGRFVDAGPLAPAEGLFATAWPRGAACARVDVAAMLRQRPQEVAARLQSVLGRFQTLPALPSESWSVTRAEEAPAWLAEHSRDQGLARLTLTFADGEPLALAPAADEPLFDANATYLVTGGFGGFGLALARWMVAEGARNLVLTGRKGASTPEARQLVQELEAAGARVTAAAADVSSMDDMRALFARIDATHPPIKGVLHTAAVLDDAPMPDLNLERIQRVMAPKAGGAWTLHELTQDRQLDLFVLFSSVAALIGNPRQGNYVAANSFLDALAEHRAARGLAAISIHWGVLGEFGMAQDEAVRTYLESLGLNPMAPATVLTALKRVLRLRTPQLGLFDVQWSKLGRAAPHLGKSARTAHLLGSAQGGAQSEAEQLRGHLSGLAPEARQPELEKFLVERLATILQIPMERVEPQKPLSLLGVDSLLSMQVQRTIREALGVEIPALELLRAGSLVEVATNLSSKFDGPAAAAAAPAPEPVTEEAEIEQQVNSMSESELDTILQAMLAAQTAQERETA
ncbi:type I polyketide synthase [Myxococcus sp. NMCA1]|uniref:type I polyketide synthase n=1 Tax=Myxococcus sp. NMCA1 TaxID=2996785 RepID=UPI002286857A|nr:type I polyketide synthase [Myxococcus sp. NMCA1]WAM23066.1 SDR family NAD(P)-dependent oxidoreductase [Myxococcus sp. NMCA1]